MREVNIAPVNVVVVFYSRHGETEQLALAAGVGAVQARANIRLRRLNDLADAESIAGDPRWAENLERMNRDYIAPREIDAAWADVILVGSCPHSLRETEEYVKSILATPGRSESLLIVPLVDAPADRLASARSQAKRAVEEARERKG